jgi:hypothetical protein
LFYLNAGLFEKNSFHGRLADLKYFICSKEILFKVLNAEEFPLEALWVWLQFLWTQIRET